MQIVTSALIDENNNNETNSNDQTPESGFFLSPSTISGRSSDVSNFAVTAANSYGKLEFTDPNDFGGQILFTDLSDVSVSPSDNDILVWDNNNSEWTNQNTVELTTLIAGSNTSTVDIESSNIGFFDQSPTSRPAVDGSDTTNFSANSSSATDGGASTYDGYTVGGIIKNLAAIGLINQTP